MSFEKNSTQRKFCEIAAFIQKKNRFPEGLLKRYYKKLVQILDKNLSIYLTLPTWQVGIFFGWPKKIPPKNFPTCCTLCILIYSHWDIIPKNTFSHFQILKQKSFFD